MRYINAGDFVRTLEGQNAIVSKITSETMVEIVTKDGKRKTVRSMRLTKIEELEEIKNGNR